MENKASKKDIGNIFGIISIVIPSVTLILVLNWFFKLTQFQQFQGMFLLAAPIAGIIGFTLALASAKMKAGRLAKWGIVSNVAICILPFIYWILGTLIFGV